MPTLADVAKVAGVGVMSVSRVVNGTRKVSRATEEKVREAIRRIGYEPNEAARILKGHRARIIGLIVPDLADPFFGVCANAIQESAREAGYMTLISASGHRVSVEREQAEVMMQRQVAGLIIVPMGDDNAYFLKALESGLPVVALDRPLGGIDADAVLVDNRQASMRMVKHLVEQGHRHILGVTDEERIFTRQERLAGYMHAMHQAKLRPQTCVVGPTSGSFADQFPSIFNSGSRPTAIFALGDMITIEVLRHLQEKKLRIPQEIALVSFDDFDAATLVSSPITVIRQPIADLGHRALTLLLERIEGKNTDPPHRVVLKTELIIRDSSGSGQQAMPSKGKKGAAVRK